MIPCILNHLFTQHDHDYSTNRSRNSFCYRPPFDTAFTRPNGNASHLAALFHILCLLTTPQKYWRPLFPYITLTATYGAPHTVFYLYPAPPARHSLKNQMLSLKHAIATTATSHLDWKKNTGGRFRLLFFGFGLAWLSGWLATCYEC